ncbi:hypothetical protein HWV62_24145 [Athelia sp. TMB]|nr:hypothetical protein HWV62_24145 [Athelia sp. TMB]
MSRDGHSYDYISAKQQSKRIVELEQQLLKQQEADSNLRNALQDKAEEIEELRARLKQAEATKMPDFSENTGTGRTLGASSRVTDSADSFHPSPEILSLSAQLVDLRERYDALAQAKDAAATAYKKDYRQWREFKRHIYRNNLQSKKSRGLGNDAVTARRKLHALGGSSTTEKMMEEALGAAYPISYTMQELFDQFSTDNKENNDLPAASLPRDNEMRPPLQSYNMFNSSPLAFPNTHVAPKRKSPNGNDPQPSVASSFGLQYASDISPGQPAIQRQTRQPDALSHMPSSETEDDSQAPLPLNKQQPSGSRSSTDRHARHSTPSTSEKGNCVDKTLMQILSHGLFLSELSSSGQASAGPRLRKPHDTNYLEYKGRGRYARDAQQDPDKTINAQFEINPSRNGGLPFQFDAVIRNKEDRKHLHAGDCECCRDYYEAVGALPSGLRQPRWRSPTSTPASIHKHQRSDVDASIAGSSKAHADARREEEIDHHKRKISRHRYNWERASTPPGYWDIGFPTTQEASVINEKAKEIHIQKMEMVEKEANMMEDTGNAEANSISGTLIDNQLILQYYTLE